MAVPRPGLVPGTFSKLNPVALTVVRARRTGWDQLRILAFVDVASFHILGIHLLLGIGLPVFLLLVVILSARNHAVPLSVLARRRGQRLVIPWLFWSFVFAFAHGLRAWVHGGEPWDWWEPNMVWTGTELHLWFLPFAAAMSLASTGCARLAERVPTALFIFTCMLTASAATWLSGVTTETSPLAQWSFSLPALPLGLAFARLVGWVDPRLHLSVRGAVKVAAALAAALGLWAVGWSGLFPHSLDTLVRYGAAFVLLIGATLLPSFAVRPTRWIESNLMGAYILHVEVTWELAARVTDRPGGRAALGMVLTVLIVALLRQTPLRRML